MLRDQQGDVAGPIGIAEPGGQDGFESDAGILVFDQFFEQSDRAVDPVLPRAQNTRSCGANVRILGAQQSTQQVRLDDAETFVDPESPE